MHVWIIRNRWSNIANRPAMSSSWLSFYKQSWKTFTYQNWPCLTNISESKASFTLPTTVNQVYQLPIIPPPVSEVWVSVPSSTGSVWECFLEDDHLHLLGQVGEDSASHGGGGYSPWLCIFSCRWLAVSQKYPRHRQWYLRVVVCMMAAFTWLW